MVKPNPKYGWFGSRQLLDHQLSTDEKFQKSLVEEENERLRQQVQCLNEVIEELARELPKDLVLTYTVQPWEKDPDYVNGYKPTTLDDLVTSLRANMVVANTVQTDELTSYHRVPKQLKGRPERVPDEHFLDLLF